GPKLFVSELQLRNEELRASHEEVTSINEELQSTNEELETSKEELQSLNEELTTVNAQLQTKVLEHEAITNDLGSLLLSTDIAVVFLDREFKIRRYTPAVRELFDLIPTDAGRPLANLARKFVDDDLMKDASSVLERLVPLEREITSENGRWYLRRLLPYRTVSNQIDGVVITFIDLTTSKRAERRLAEKARLLDLSGDAIVVCDLQRRVAFWNRGATRQFGFKSDEAMGRPLLELLQNEAFQPPAGLEARSGTDPVVSEVTHVTKDGRKQIALCRWALERDAEGKPLSFLLSSTDVTEQRSDSEALRFGQEQLRMLVDGARDYAMVLLDPDGIITAWNVGAERVLGYREAEAVGQSIGLIFTPED
ncbi:MAG: PAS domain S-box protein, partial [Proteobacteria bacterium]